MNIIIVPTTSFPITRQVQPDDRIMVPADLKLSSLAVLETVTRISVIGFEPDDAVKLLADWFAKRGTTLYSWYLRQMDDQTHAWQFSISISDTYPFQLRIEDFGDGRPHLFLLKEITNVQDIDRTLRLLGDTDLIPRSKYVGCYGMTTKVAAYIRLRGAAFRLP